MKYKIIIFITCKNTYIINYISYYIFIIRYQKKRKYRKLSSDAIIFKEYYKIDIKKIGYMKFYRILDLINSLLLTFLTAVVYNIKSNTVKIIILIILMLPTIWCVYYFASKLFNYLERKGEKNV